MEGEFTLLEHRATGVLYFIVGIIGVMANLVIIVIFSREKPLAGSRSSLHIHLAIANIMIVAGVPLSGTSAFSGEWLYGNLGCKLYGLLTYTGGTGAVTLAQVLCVERFLATVCKDFYFSMSGSINGFLVSFAWIYTLAMSLAPLLGWNRYVIEPPGTACGLDWADSESSYFIVLPCITFIMLIVALVSLWTAHSNTEPEMASSPADKKQASSWFTENQQNWIATTNILIVTIGFAPYGFLSVWTVYNKSHQMTMLASVLPPLVAKFSCGFYPISYLVASSRFRSAYACRTIGGSDVKKQN